ncbi:hypothetical protein RB195_002849 [Necator americanus]|uniref:Ion transport domain-containing protein n=1 Tax=Necator americanus TaxID=51031 RepID=A0ABR1DNS4_NECAM
MPPATRVSEPWLCSIAERYTRKFKRIRLGFFEWSSEHLFGFYRNMVIIVNYILLSVLLIHAGFTQGEIVGYWAALATLSDLIFHVSFLFAAVSMIRFLSVFYFFSVLTFMLRRMVRTLGKFLLIFVMFWVIFAVCHISMAEEYPVRSNHSLVWMMFQNGAFEIFGEVDDEDKVGSVTGCGETSWKSMWTANISDMRCLFRSTLIPITVFTYMLVASIMLVNLLTALLSKEYDEVSGGGSAIYWKYENYFLLATYESKLWLPPPLSLVYYLLHLILLLTRTIACFSCIFCICCSPSVLKNNPFSFIPKWLGRIFRAIEGRPWGTLKQVRRHYRDLIDLDEVRRLVPKKNKKSLFHSRLRDLLNSSSQEEGSSPEGRILNAQALFQNIFNILMECIQEETGQIRTRANTAVGDLQNHLHHCGSNSMPDLLKGESAPEISRPTLLESNMRRSPYHTFSSDLQLA